jgi:prephenate dehydratase
MGNRQMTTVRVSYLGPEGTYAHQVARHRFGEGAEYVPCDTIDDVFSRLAARDSRFGVVPIENSSGGPILLTVDTLLSDGFPQKGIVILEGLAMDVRLALVASRGTREIARVYSHHAALAHCRDWLDANLPDAERVEAPSTSVAARTAAGEKGAAAIASRGIVDVYPGLEVRVFPVASEVRNVTQFLLLGERGEREAEGTKTTIAFRLADRTGALYHFLGPFANRGINLTRIVSRPVRGEPGQYAFLIDIDGSSARANVREAVREAEEHAVFVRVLGSYPVREPYQS